MADDTLERDRALYHGGDTRTPGVLPGIEPEDVDGLNLVLGILVLCAVLALIGWGLVEFLWDAGWVHP